MADRSIAVKLSAEVGQYKSAMGDAAKATDQVGTSADKAAGKGKSAFDRLEASAKKNSSAYRTVGTGMVAVGGSILAIGAAALKTGIAYNTLQQTSRAALKTLLGSTKAANAQMDKLDEFARNSPFAKGVFIKAQQQLLGFGMSASKVIPTLDAIQNAVAAVGGSNDDIAGIVLTLAKVKGQGKITADTLNELGVRGVDAATLIGSQMGKTGAQIREDITKGAIGADQALAALTAGMQAKFGGAAANVKNTFGGAVDRVKAAWRDLSAELAAPLVGPQGGGLAVGGLNKLADAMRAFENLPGPLRNSVLGITGVVGAASLLGGSLLLLIPRIATTRLALADLKTSAPGVIGAFGRIGKAAGILTAALLAIEAVKYFNPDNTQSVSKISKSIVGLSKDSKTAKENLDSAFTGTNSFIAELTGSGASVTGLSDALTQLKGSQGFLGKFGELGGSMFGLFDSGSDIASAAVKKFDDTLTAMVAGGQSKEAANGFDLFSKQATKAGFSAEKIRDMLPGYGKALDDATVAQRLTGKSLGDLGLKAGASADEIKAAAEAFAKIKGATRDAALSFFDFGKGLDSNKTSFSGWIKGLKEMAAAQRDWQKNMITAQTMGATDEVLQKFQELGPAGAKMLAQLVDKGVPAVEALNKVLAGAGNSADNFSDKMHSAMAKIPSEVRTKFATEGAGISAEKALALQRRYKLTPKQVATLLKANNAASDVIARVLRELRGARGQSATVTITTLRRNVTENFNKLGSTTLGGAKRPRKAHGGRLPQGFAGGGVVPGEAPAHPYQDNVFAMSESGNPLMVRSGEWIVNQKASEKNDKWLEAMNNGLVLPKFAGGGMVGSGVGPNPMPVASSGSGFDERALKRAFEGALDGMKFQLSQDNRYLKTRVRNG